MVTFFNDKLTNERLTLAAEDRALQFGDGLFETILIHNKKPQLIEYHISRIAEGSGCMQLDLPATITDPDKLIHKINKLLHLNSLNEAYAKAKLIVWRKNINQHGYTSHDKDVNYLITVKPFNPKDQKKYVIAGVSERVKNHYWYMSAYKKLNALPYIIASQERDTRKLDELILLDVHEHVSECISSNIFWIKDQKFYTPDLKTGCVRGIMRTVLMSYLKNNNYALREVIYDLDELKHAETIFTTNSLGIKVISSLNNIKYSGSDILKDFNKKLTQVNFLG